MSTFDYKFLDKVTITDPLKVFFLCGTKYEKKDANDKRNVLKAHIESQYSKNHKVIILEEHFIFGKTNNNYLSYDEIFMKNLKDIELLTGLFSDKIFIIHESISTAAELGMFASNSSLLTKTCLIIPDSFSVEEEKLSSFIRLAFFNSRSPEEKMKKITFYPKIQKHFISNTKVNYHTLFPKNKIKSVLSSNIENFIKEGDQPLLNITFNKQKFRKVIKDQGTVSYFYDASTLNIFMPAQVIRILVISLFNIDHFRGRLRGSTAIKDAVTIVERYLEGIMINTISQKEGIDFSLHKIYISINDNNIKIRETLAYFLYILQAIDMVKLPVRNKNEKVTISPKFQELYIQFAHTLEEIKISKFGASLLEKEKP